MVMGIMTPYEDSRSRAVLGNTVRKKKKGKSKVKRAKKKDCGCDA